MTTRDSGLRERKKQATRHALRNAALKLALEHGPENVRVNDIAAAAGVSPRTYNNYYSSREHAIVAAITADRDARIAADVAKQPPEVSLSVAVIDAIVKQYTDPDDQARDHLLMIATSPTLRASYTEAAEMLEDPLAEAIGERRNADDRWAAPVLAAAVGAAVRVALKEWLRSPVDGLVVPAGSLPDLLRAALEPLAPALDAAG